MAFRPERLYDLRVAAGLSVYDLAKKAGFLFRMLMAFESAKSVPSFADARSWPTLLECWLDDSSELSPSRS